MSNWNNWSWERNMKKTRKSYSNAKKQNRTIIRTETKHINANIRPIPTLCLILTYWVFGVGLIRSIILALLLALAFGITAHTDIHDDYEE